MSRRSKNYADKQRRPVDSDAVGQMIGGDDIRPCGFVQVECGTCRWSFRRDEKVYTLNPCHAKPSPAEVARRRPAASPRHPSATAYRPSSASSSSRRPTGWASMDRTRPRNGAPFRPAELFSHHGRFCVDTC